MTVISLAQSNIVRSCSSVYKKELCKKSKARKLLAIFLIFLIGASIFLYVLQINSIAAKGYKIRNLKTRAYELEEQNKNLQVSVSNLKSIDNLQTQIEYLEMVKVKNVDYVNLTPVNVIAAK